MTADVVRSLSTGQAEIAAGLTLFSQIEGCPLAEDQAFQEGIAGQAVTAVNAVAARFADGVEMVHRRLTVAIDVDAAHEIVLSRRDRDPVDGGIDAVFEAAFINIGEMAFDDVFPRPVMSSQTKGRLSFPSAYE